MAIQRGDHFIARYNQLIVFGHVPSMAELEEEELRLGATPTEWNMTRRYIEAAERRMDVLWSRGYSVVEPHGEWGMTRIDRATPITRQQFETAREYEWEIEQLRLHGHEWLDDKLEELRSHN